MKNEIINGVVESCHISIQLVSQRKLLISFPYLGTEVISTTMMLKKSPLCLRGGVPQRRLLCSYIPWSSDEVGRDVPEEHLRTEIVNQQGRVAQIKKTLNLTQVTLNLTQVTTGQ